MTKSPKQKFAAHVDIKRENVKDTKPIYEVPKIVDLGEIEEGEGGLPVCVGGSMPAPACFAGILDAGS